MISDDLISDHYRRPGLLAAIEKRLAALGKTTDALTIDDLAELDEFHTGGRRATELVLQGLGLSAGMTVLDVGCGLGGAARYCAATFGCRVTGIDLTESNIEVAKVLTGWVGLSSSVSFRHVSAQEMQFKRNSFDAAYMLHVGMNVADKTGLFSGIRKALRSRGRLAVYDLMRAGPGDLTFPMPWATSSATSLVSTQASYESSLVDAGFEVERVDDRTELAKAFIAQVRDRSGPVVDLELPVGDQAPSRTPPPVGPHLLMGDQVEAKTTNLIDAFDAGILAPIEIIARKAR